MLSWLGRGTTAEKPPEDQETASRKPEPTVGQTGSKPLLTVSNVERSFDVGSQKIRVLKGINLELYPQQLVMLRGRSGSGKTTLMNLMGGLDTPTEGEIHFKDRPFHKWDDDKRTEVRRKDIGFIFQAYALMPLLSAYENVELSLRMANVPRAEWKARINSCLDLVGLSKRMHHRPFELSGGEQHGCDRQSDRPPAQPAAGGRTDGGVGQSDGRSGHAGVQGNRRDRERVDLHDDTRSNNYGGSRPCL